MVEAITSGVTQVITYVGQVITAITGASGAWKDLLPVIGLAIAVMFVIFAIRMIKSLIKGY